MQGSDKERMLSSTVNVSITSRAFCTASFSTTNYIYSNKIYSMYKALTPVPLSDTMT